MLVSKDSRVRRLVRPLVALIITIIIVTGSTYAAQPGGAHSSKANFTNPPIECVAPYIYFIPEAGGPCNGCTVHVGDHFVLDMRVHSSINDDATAQQSYLTFTNALLLNVRPNTCVPYQFVTGDLETFDALLQNEVCNGPEPCIFRG